jgi:hypothetical protein
MLGDGNCDPECNVDHCHFDLADCAQSAWVEGQCTQELLDNSKCDAECDTKESSYDNFRCVSCIQSCAEGCSLELMLNGVCDEVCSSEECQFDFYDCRVDTQFCTYSKLTNGISDDLCYHKYSLFDNFVKLPNYEAYGCAQELGYNGKCDADCSFVGNSFDNNECDLTDCPVDCTQEMRNNEECDDPCNEKSCRFDGLRCECSPGCKYSAIGNGTCDESCYNEACSFDELDCTAYHCSTDCPESLRWNDLCDQGCDNPECQYDRGLCNCALECGPELLGNGSCDEECDNQACGVDGGECGACASGCFHELLGDGTCQEVCNNEECQWDFSECDSSESQFCEYDSSLTCAWQYCGSCVEICPSSTYPNSSKGACLDLADLSSERNPAQYTVGAQGYFGGETLKEVLEKLWMPYNEVLLTESLYALGTSTDDKSLAIQASVKLLRIKAVCPSEAICTAEVRLMSPYLVLSGAFDLELKSLKWEGKYSLDNACVDSDSCTYCPYLLELDGSYYDDRFNYYEVRPSWPKCSYADLSLIRAKQVTLTEVSFTNCRQNYRALIEASESLSLTQVTFDNISVEGQEGAAVVRLSCSSDDCSFKYKGGSVSRLNNGYELLQSTIQAGFLSLINARSIEVQAVSFSLFSVYQGSSSEAVSPPLIYIENCKGTSTLEQISADSLVLSSGLVSVKATDVEHPAGQTIHERWRLLAASHIKLKDFTVARTSSDFLLLVELGGFLQNVEIEGLTVTDSAFTSSIIKVSKSDSPSTVEVEGGLIPYKTMSFETTLKTPNFFCLVNAVFTATYWADSLAKLINLANIAVQDIKVSRSGNFYGGLQEFAYDTLRTSSEYYAIDSKKWPVALGCNSAFDVYASSIGTFTDLDFRESKCDGIFGIAVQSFQGSVNHKQLSISNWKFFDITSISTPSSLMYFYEMREASLLIEGLEAEAITNSKGIGVLAFYYGNLTIKDSKFKRIHTLSTGGLYLESIFTAEFDNLEFEDVTSTSFGGCINIYFEYTAAQLLILNSKFIGCISEISGGAIYIDFAPVSLELIVKGSLFKNNHCPISGSAIYQTSSVNLHASSIIDSCDFIDNPSAFNGVLALNVNNAFAFTNLKFSNNTGGSCICTITQEKDNLLVLMKTVQFLNNSSKSILCLNGFSSLSQYNFEDFLFQSNTGFIAYISTGTLIIRGIKLLKNSNALWLSSSKVKISDLEATENTSTTNASVFELTEDNELECTSCRFIRNKGFRGTIKVDNSLIYLKDCTFTENSATDAASVLYIINSFKESTVKNSVFTSNHSSLSGTIYLVESSLELDGVVFKQNTADLVSAGVIIQSSILKANDCAFSEQTADLGAFFISTSNSSVTIQRSTFSQGRSTQGGGVAAIQNSVLTMSDCKVTDIVNILGGAITADLRFEVSISRTSFTNVRTDSEGAAISAYSGKLTLSEVSVSDFYSTALYASDMSEVVLHKVTITSKA